MKVIEKAIFVATDCEMYADMIENNDLMVGRLEIDNEKAFANFVIPNKLNIQIPDCKGICITESGAFFWNKIGKWEFETIA